MLERIVPRVESLPYEHVTYAAFSKAMDKRIFRINQRVYEECYGGADTETIAVLVGLPEINLGQLLFRNSIILINVDKFRGVDRKKKNIMIQTVVLHEKIECWELLGDERDLQTIGAKGQPHKTALLHEFYYASTQGLAKEYLEQLRICSLAMESSIANDFYRENVDAYNSVVYNNWKPEDDYTKKKLSDIRR